MSTKITVEQIGNFRFESKNAGNSSIIIDGPKSIGGTEDGFRPMELLLAGIATCSAMDILSILEKSKNRPDSLSIEVEGERNTDHPKVFHSIKLIYKMKGEVDRGKAERAVSLSLEKYCSAAAMLSKTAGIKSEIIISE